MQGKRPKSASSELARTIGPAPAAIQKAALAWFSKHRRDLPWRVAKDQRGKAARPDPYGVWVSEIMSQQTQIATMIPYWEKWMKRFPTVAALAESSEEAVRGAWAGLGYYRRAANLRRGALYVMEKHKGLVPQTSKELCEIPGIGPYTAGAVASICYGEAVPAVDGNVIRVLSRLLAEPNVDPKTPAASKWARRCAEDLMKDCSDPGSFNEGLMEIGATICRPTGSPNCSECPLAAHCRAKGLVDAGELETIEGRYPMRGKATAKTTCCVSCAIHCIKKASEGGTWRVLLVQRPAQGLLAGMYDFPSFSATSASAGKVTTGPAAVLGAKEANVEGARLVQGLKLAPSSSTGKGRDKTAREEDHPSTPRYQGTVKHVFSHLNMFLNCFVVEWPSDEALCKAVGTMMELGLLGHASVAREQEEEVSVSGGRDGAKPAKRARHEAPPYKILALNDVKSVPVSRLVHKALAAAQF